MLHAGAVDLKNTDLGEDCVRLSTGKAATTIAYQVIE
jgi:hypothetical protein